jgi:hypothetical protein
MSKVESCLFENIGSLSLFCSLCALVLYVSIYCLYTLDPETHIPTDTSRKLGLVVVRGTQVSLVSPQEGAEEIANPFLAAEEEEGGEEG